MKQLNIMSRNKKRDKRISKKGLPPGTKVYTGASNAEEVKMTVIKYNPERVEKFTAHMDDLPQLFQEKDYKIWLDVDGVHDVEKVVFICEKLGIHLLHQEDILNVYQRPKLEEEDDYTLLIIRMIHHIQEETMEAEVEQLGLLVKDNILISFQETKLGDVFDPIRVRFQKDGSKLRERNVDYLLYALFDVIVDSYLENLIKLEEFMENMEEEMITELAHYDAYKILGLKKILLEHKKAILPLKEIMPMLLRTRKEWIQDNNQRFFMDLHDHVLMAYEMLESQLDLQNSIKDMYLNRMNRDMNNVMKVLTIISTVFIPLTFIVGVYGMNFKHMPELEMRNGYYYTLAGMLTLALFLLGYFKWKKWI